jgi:molybdate transport system permease protein
MMSPLLISLKVACWVTVLILPPGVLLGLLLARGGFRGKSLIETAATLPLVLPPTAVGYLLLRLLGRYGPLGEPSLGFDLDLLFTWEGMARTLGLGRIRTFVEITLPLARRGLLAAAILGFSRALGEFGATVIVAGSIPGRTQTLALAIFNDMQIGHDDEAMALVAVTVALAFAAVFTVEILLRKRPDLA